MSSNSGEHKSDSLSEVDIVDDVVEVLDEDDRNSIRRPSGKKYDTRSNKCRNHNNNSSSNNSKINYNNNSISNIDNHTNNGNDSNNMKSNNNSTPSGNIQYPL